MSYAQDAYIRQAQAHEATFAESDERKRLAKQARDDAEYEATRAAVARTNPMPIDTTALRGHHMGLTEWMTERGD